MVAGAVPDTSLALELDPGDDSEWRLAVDGAEFLCQPVLQEMQSRLVHLQARFSTLVRSAASFRSNTLSVALELKPPCC